MTKRILFFSFKHKFSELFVIIVVEAVDLIVLVLVLGPEIQVAGVELLKEFSFVNGHAGGSCKADEDWSRLR